MTLRVLVVGIGITILQPFVLPGQTKATCEQGLTASFQPGGRLRMEIRSGDIEITGTNAQSVRVSCELKDPEQAKDVSIRFHVDTREGDLRIHGGPNNDVHLRIEVPKSSNLMVRAPAGDLTVSDVTGDKDIEIHAGDLTIAVGNPADYKHADASIWAGDLDASAFGVNKDGLFRSFSKENSAGKYRLHAHLLAGDLTLK
ncbi:MAG TPA: hypothetical protein VLX58_01575 [Bryobacteraceae bacterium]|nr:hypothetical protein [Bryobacteraceae bacterium]